MKSRPRSVFVFGLKAVLASALLLALLSGPVVVNRSPAVYAQTPLTASGQKSQPVKLISQEKKSPPKTIDEYLSEGQNWLLSSGLHVLIILLLMSFALKSTNVFARQLLAIFTKNKEGTELKKRADTATSVVRYILIASIVAIAGMMVLKELGIEIGPILAGAGVVGLAVGFGAQNLVKDIISGFFILLEDQIRVGDVVQIADKSGVVEKVTLRMVVLRDVSYNVHYIPSGEIKVVTNMTKKYSGFVYDIGVAYRENIDQVIELMTEIDTQMRSEEEYETAILEPLEVFGLQEFADSAVIIRARSKTETGKQWKVGREFKKRLKERFDQLAIEIPYPHMTVYAGADKNGQAPPVHISIENRSEASS